MLKVGFIGFGEAASQISLGLNDSNKVNIYAYDILLNDKEMRPLLEERASRCAVTLSHSLADLAGNTEIIFSAVTSSVALKVADQIRPYLTDKHIFVDLNAITPETSQQVASIVEETGAIFIDGAMVSSLKVHKHKVPMLVSGKGVDFFTNKVAPLGFNLQIVGKEPGKASGNKLIRSVFTKGFAALLIETLTYAHKLGYYDVVLQSMLNTLKAEPSDLINRLVTGTMIHSQRRLGELSGAKEMLQQAGIDSKMIEATMEVIKKVDSLEFDENNITGEAYSAIETLSAYY